MKTHLPPCFLPIIPFPHLTFSLHQPFPLSAYLYFHYSFPSLTSFVYAFSISFLFIKSDSNRACPGVAAEERSHRFSSSYWTFFSLHIWHDPYYHYCYFSGYLCLAQVKQISRLGHSLGGADKIPPNPRKEDNILLEVVCVCLCMCTWTHSNFDYFLSFCLNYLDNYLKPRTRIA